MNYNYVHNAGSTAAEDPYIISDGITIGHLDNGSVSHNYVADATDVDFIIGGGINGAVVQGNTVVNTTRAVLAAFMLTNFSDYNNPVQADFRGIDVSGNTINCGSYCDIGLQLGVYTFLYQPAMSGPYINGYEGLRTMGGSVHDNTITASKEGINIAGAGTNDYALTMYGNVVNDSYSSSTQMVGHACLNGAGNPRETGKLNVYALFTESTINFLNGQEQLIDTTDSWHMCY